MVVIRIVQQPSPDLGIAVLFSTTLDVTLDLINRIDFTIGQPAEFSLSAQAVFLGRDLPDSHANQFGSPITQQSSKGRIGVDDLAALVAIDAEEEQRHVGRIPQQVERVSLFLLVVNGW